MNIALDCGRRPGETRAWASRRTRQARPAASCGMRPRRSIGKALAASRRGISWPSKHSERRRGGPRRSPSGRSSFEPGSRAPPLPSSSPPWVTSTRSPGTARRPVEQYARVAEQEGSSPRTASTPISSRAMFQLEHGIDLAGSLALARRVRAAGRASRPTTCSPGRSSATGAAESHPLLPPCPRLTPTRQVLPPRDDRALPRPARRGAALVPPRARTNPHFSPRWAPVARSALA